MKVTEIKDVEKMVDVSFDCSPEEMEILVEYGKKHMTDKDYMNFALREIILDYCKNLEDKQDYMKKRKISKLDLLVYRLFRWRWNSIFKNNPELWKHFTTYGEVYFEHVKKGK